MNWKYPSEKIPADLQWHEKMCAVGSRSRLYYAKASLWQQNLGRCENEDLCALATSPNVLESSTRARKRFCKTASLSSTESLGAPLSDVDEVPLRDQESYLKEGQGLHNYML